MHAPSNFIDTVRSEISVRTSSVSKDFCMNSVILSLVAPIAVVAFASTQANAQGIQIGATIETNYTANFNRPSTRLNGAIGAPYYFNAKEGSTQLNLGELHFFSDPSDKRKTGFSIRMVDGNVVAGLPLGLAGVNTTTSTVYEAYARVIAGGAKPVTIDAGIFPTHVGYETIPTGTSAFFTKAFQFGQLQPFYHSGVRAQFAATPRATAMLSLLNRYNGVESNGSRTPGLGLQWNQVLSSKDSVIFNFARAKDTVAGAERDKAITNFGYSRTLAPNLTLATDASIVSGVQAGSAGYKAGAVTGYLTYAIKSGDTISIRAEQLADDTAGGLFIPSADPGTKPTLSSFTLTYEFKKGQTAASRTMVELRHDKANTGVFSTASGTAKSSTTLTIGQVFSF